MNLQADLSGQRNLGIFFRVVDGLHAVDKQLDVRPFAHDAVVVPVVFLQHLVKCMNISVRLKDVVLARSIVLSFNINLT